MRLQHIDIAGFKSFAKKSTLTFTAPVTAVVGPNGSGKSNVVEAFRFVMGEQSMKSMRGKSGADLIFRGSNSTAKLSRASVAITFDNRDKVFAFHNEVADQSKTPVLFDTITFARELYADGTSKYLMNGTEVRLKQVVELLASVNIGTSSHHIISQGEADSILRASPRDRREMLEDALGLKVYHMRIRESENKLARSLDTLKEVQLLRRELAPHLKFLQKQVEKIEKGRAIRTELEEALLTYLATERAVLLAEENKIAQAGKLTESTKKRLLEALKQLPDEEQVTEDVSHITELRNKLIELRSSRSAVEQKMARLEGIIEAHRSMLARPKATTATAVTFQEAEYSQILSEIESCVASIKSADTLEATKALMVRLEAVIAKLRSRGPKYNEQDSSNTSEHSMMLRDTALELEGLERNLKSVIGDQEAIEAQLKAEEAARESRLVQAKNATKERYELQAQLTQCDAEIQILEVSSASARERKEHFDTELKEAAFLFGPSFLRTLEGTASIFEIDLHTHRRTIDRLKIRLDEHSGIGNEVLGEYESTKERDIFLAREVADTESSIRNLEGLIIDLKRVLDEKFSTGVQVINERFGEFFKTMFGGGSAFLSITVEKRRRKKGEEIDEEAEENDEHFMERGIEVHVNLPEKKVKELHMLSGGERSLVSIALLFAISQVNPPPFLVLDETDAALDEANSRKYGDMIEKLAAYSQLIVVTHNRETMSRANVLYGVTLGSDGASKLLSIKFDDAVKVAK